LRNERTGSECLTQNRLFVYELFFTNLPQQAFTTSDVVELYLHHGASEPLLSDEDNEQGPARWCGHTACGQEVWGIVSQWVWNLRLELGHPSPALCTFPH
jgi:hypothetical protein